MYKLSVIKKILEQNLFTNILTTSYYIVNLNMLFKTVLPKIRVVNINFLFFFFFCRSHTNDASFFFSLLFNLY